MTESNNHEEPMEYTISAKTGVSIALVGSLLGAFIGGVIWLSNISSLATQGQESANRNRMLIQELSTDIVTLTNDGKNVTDRMARIETKIDILIDQVKK